MLVTVDPDKRWEYCDIPICGGRYNASYGRPRQAVVGIMLVTICGIKGDINIVSEGPRCYTVDPDKRWEYCDIPICGGRYNASYGRPRQAVGILRHSDMRW